MRIRKEHLGCPITMGEYERVVKNLEIYKQLNEVQKEWLDGYIYDYNYNFRDFVMKIDDERVLWLIFNTKNSVREFDL